MIFDWDKSEWLVFFFLVLFFLFLGFSSGELSGWRL